jgi:hypothetical protein
MGEKQDMQRAHDAVRIDQPVWNGRGTLRNVAESTGHSSRTPNSGQYHPMRIDPPFALQSDLHDLPIAIPNHRIPAVTVDLNPWMCRQISTACLPLPARSQPDKSLQVTLRWWTGLR